MKKLKVYVTKDQIDFYGGKEVMEKQLKIRHGQRVELIEMDELPTETKTIKVPSSNKDTNLNDYLKKILD